MIEVGIVGLPLLVEVLLLDGRGEEGQAEADHHGPGPEEGPNHELGVIAFGDPGIAPRLVPQPGVL